jgi:hypothetical protein
MMRVPDPVDIDAPNPSDTIDYKSDTNDFDIELSDTTDTISEIIDDPSADISNSPAASPSDIPNSRTGSPFTTDDLTHFMERRLLSIDPFTTMALGKLTYHMDFHPHYVPPDREGGFGKTLYKMSRPNENVEGEELGLVFFGEVCSSLYGTAITAKGNHYAGTSDNPKVRSYSI